jgi:hypothetical protein
MKSIGGINSGDRGYLFPTNSAVDHQDLRPLYISVGAREAISHHLYRTGARLEARHCHDLLIPLGKLRRELTRLSVHPADSIRWDMMQIR